MLVFARGSGAHRYDEVLAAWLEHRHCDHRAMAWNLICDHRVTEERARLFESFVPASCDSAGLIGALTRYKSERVRQAAVPDFAVEEVNGPNVVSGGASGDHRIPRDANLVRIVDLNGLEDVYGWAAARIPAFRRFTRRGPRGVDEFLVEELGEPRQFVGNLLDALNTYRLEVAKHHPSWVTFWEDLAPHLAGGADRWAQVVGIDVPPGHWLMLLRYSARRAGTIARPTQLDAGWDANHFPSPPEVPLSSGGHPVDMHDGAGWIGRLLPEFVHEQVEHYPADWFAAGERIERTTGATCCSLEHARERHHALLVSAYGAPVTTWMPRSH